MMESNNDLFAKVLGVLSSRTAAGKAAPAEALSVEDELACRATCQSARDTLLPSEINARRLLDMLTKEQHVCPSFGAYVGTLLYLAVPAVPYARSGAAPGYWGVAGARSAAPVPAGRLAVHRFAADESGLLRWEPLPHVTLEGSETPPAEDCDGASTEDSPLMPPPLERTPLPQRLLRLEDSRRWLRDLLLAGWRVAGWSKAYQERHYLRPFGLGLRQPWTVWPSRPDYIKRQEGCTCVVCKPT